MKRSLSMLFFLILMTGCFSIGEEPKDRVPSDIDYSRLHHLFLDSSVQEIVVDIDYVQGRNPSSLVLDAIREEVGAVAPHRTVSIPKPTRVNVSDTSIDRVWDRGELEQIVEKYRSNYGDHAAVIHIIILNGHVGEGSEYRIAFFNAVYDAVLFFPDDLQMMVRVGPAQPPHPGFPEIERGLLMHEVGHAIGLVDNGAPMLEHRLPSKQIDPCQCHSTQEDSPLFYRFSDEGWLMEKMEDNQHIPYRYNSDDRADLAAFIKGYGGR